MKKQMLNEGEIRKMMKFANIQKLTENFLDTQITEEEEEVTEEGLEESPCAEQNDGIHETEEEIEVEDELGAEGELDVDVDELPGDEAAEIELEEPAPAGNTEIAQRLAAGIADLLSQVLDVEVDAEMTGDAMDDTPDEIEVEDDIDVDLEEPTSEEEADLNTGMSGVGGDDDDTEMGHIKEEEELEEEQGYDDKEDERLGMKRGKTADKDLKGSKKKKEKSRRNDAGFERANESVDSDELVNEITRRVAKRLLDLKK